MGLKFSQGGEHVTVVTLADVSPVKARQKGQDASVRKPKRRTPEPLEVGNSGWAEVVALDPGGTSGWAVFAVHPEALSDPEAPIIANVEHWSCGEIVGSEETQCQEAIELLEAWPNSGVVIEDFILRQFNKGRELLSPVRITAVLSFHLYEKGRVWYRQQPSLAMTTMTDSRLKVVRMYRPGEEHAMDAVRHGLTFLRRCKEQPRLRATVWPALYGDSGEFVGEKLREPRRRDG